MDPTAAEDLALLTPRGVRILLSAGNYLLYAVKIAATELTLFGAYFVLVAAALYSIAKRPVKVARTFWLVSALLICLSIVIVIWASDMYFIEVYLEAMLLDSTTESLVERQSRYIAVTGSTQSLDIVLLWINASGDAGILLLVNDILASWRALAIWGPSRRGSKLLALTSYILLFSSAALWIAYAGVQTYFIVSGNFRVTTSNTDPETVAAITSSVCSITVNLLATGIIGYAAWGHFRDESYLGRKSFRGARVLLHLTESGLFYAMIQIVRLGLVLGLNPSTPIFGSLFTGSRAFNTASAIVTAMYTPAVILIVTHGFSIADDIQFSSGGSPEHYRPDADQTISAIRFDHRTKTGDSTIDARDQSTGTAHEAMEPEARSKRGSTADEVSGSNSADASEKTISRVA